MTFLVPIRASIYTRLLGNLVNLVVFYLTSLSCFRWIPERKALSDTSNDDGRFFAMLKTRMGSGHVLATMATGRLSSDLEEKSGLVPTHAYALLDLRQVGDLRFVKLKNPWAERSWKGKYSYQVCKVSDSETLRDFIFHCQVRKHL